MAASNLEGTGQYPLLAERCWNIREASGGKGGGRWGEPHGLLRASCPSFEKCATVVPTPEAATVETMPLATFHSDVTILISHRAGGPTWKRKQRLGGTARPLFSYTGLGNGEARRSLPGVSSVPGKKTASLNKSRTPEPSWGPWSGLWMVLWSCWAQPRRNDLEQGGMIPGRESSLSSFHKCCRPTLQVGLNHFPRSRCQAASGWYLGLQKRLSPGCPLSGSATTNCAPKTLTAASSYPDCTEGKSQRP